MKILGINQLPYLRDVSHDSAAAIVDGRGLVAAAEEERYNRVKHTRGFAKNALSFCLSQAGIGDLSELDAIAAVNNPYNLLSRWRLSTVHHNLRTDLPLLLMAELARARLRWTTRVPVHYIDHHLAHASCGYFLSPFDEANVIVIDGSGESECVSYFIAQKNSIKPVTSITINLSPRNSLGEGYSLVTRSLALGRFGEGKTMGLASYGVSRIDLSDAIKVQSFADYHVNLHRLRRICTTRMRKERDEPLLQEHKDLAASIQHYLESAIVALVKDAYTYSGIRNVVLSGGVALNCSANSRVLELDICDRIFVPPVANDSGLAIGGALYLSSKLENARPHPTRTAYLGPEYSPLEIERALKEAALSYSYISEIEREAARLICDGNVIGWFQGRMEIGPRALGNRSILADPTRNDIARRINRDIKRREPWRPFGPAIVQECAQRYFQGIEKIGESRFMLHTVKVRDELAQHLPAIVHVDQTTRPQTVTSDDNPRLYTLLREIERRNGHPIALNTSFNVDGEPIVCTPNHAIDCFKKAKLDALILDNFLVLRT